MICKQLHIEKYDWRVFCFFAVDTYYTDSICDLLQQIGISDDILQDAYIHLQRADLDTGFTFSNKAERVSVMVVGLTSTKAQFLNSFTHELRHLCDDIARASGIGLSGERVAYLTGDTAMALAPAIEPFMCSCEHCRNSLSKRLS